MRISGVLRRHRNNITFTVRVILLHNNHINIKTRLLILININVYTYKFHGTYWLE
jgi:hypothetical protein